MNISELEKIINSRNGDLFDSALLDLHRNKGITSCIPLLIGVMLDTWHEKHEDIVSLMQRDRVVGTEENLFKLALMEFEYLNYDERFGLARKCTWALADIGTEAAQKYLMQLSKCNNSIICDYANERIQNWDAEKGRKRA